MGEVYTYIAGVILSLLFAFVPTSNSWYANLSESQKRLVLLGATLLAALGYFGASCWSILALKLGILTLCNSEAALDAVLILVKMFIGSQATYTFLPENRKYLRKKELLKFRK